MISSQFTIEGVLDGFIEECPCLIEELRPMMLIADMVLAWHLRNKQCILLSEVGKILLRALLVVIGCLSAYEEGSSIDFVWSRHSIML